jgi:hypothetical protein
MSQKFYSDIEVKAGLRDSSGSLGASGQILSSTSGNVSWVTPTVNTVARDVQNEVKAGVAITKGQAVYVTGADGTNIIVGLASNTSEATSSKTLGLLNATVSVNGFADVVQIGRLAGLNTIGANAGDPVWLGTNGNLIYGLLNKPYAPAHLVFIGIVTRVNSNNGEIFINVQNGFELNEIHDVDLKTNVPINGDILGYDGTLWVNKTIAEWLGYTPANASGTTNYVSKFTGANTLGDSQIFDNGTNVGIGTSNPNAYPYGEKLSVNGNISIGGTKIGFGTTDSFVAYGWYSAAHYGISWAGNNPLTLSGYYGLGFFTNGSEKMRVTPGGEVGIGTTSPNYTTAGRGVIDINGSSQSMLALSVGGSGKGFLFHTGTDLLVSNEINGSIKLNTNGSEKAIITSAGNVGIGTTSPAYKLDVNGALRTSLGILNTDSCFERILVTPYFTDGVSNLAVNINLGNISFWGYIEVEVTGAFSNQNTAGKLTKLFAVGTNPGNLIYANESRVSDAFGPVADNMAIGNLYWDGSQYAIQLSHIVSSGNDYTVRVKMFTHLAGAKNVFDAISIGSVYSATALPKQYPYYNDRLGIGTSSPGYKLDVVGTGKFSSDLLTTGRFGVGYVNNSFASTVSAISGDAGAALFSTFDNSASTQASARFSTADLFTGCVLILPRLGAASFNGLTLANSSGVISIVNKPLLIGVQDGSAIQFTTTEIIIGTNNSEKVRITSAGNVGIGTTNPSQLLHVAGNARVAGAIYDSLDAPGSSGQILSSTNTGTKWITGGLGIHTLVKPSAGQSTSFLINSNTVGNMFGTANRLFTAPYIPANTITCSALYMNVNTTSVGGLARILIYSDNNGSPDTKIYESASLDCSTTGIKTATTTQTFIAGTTYWLCVHTSSTAGISCLNANVMIPIKMAGIVIQNGAYVTATFGSAPSTFGTPTYFNGNVPYVGITI